MPRKTNTRGSRPGREPFAFGVKYKRNECGKNRYRTREDAEIVLAVARGNRLAGLEGRREDRVYRCSACGGWHLTSQPRHAHP